MTTAFELPHMDRVIHGAGAVTELPGQLRAMGVRRPFIVASNTLATQSPVVDDIAAAVGAVGLHHTVPAHVPRTSVLEIAERCREARADGLVSVGGGSPIDATKAVAMCVGDGVEDAAGLDRLKVRYEHPGPPEVPALEGDPLPHAAVGTTLSGGEFTSIVGVTDTERGAKDLFLADRLTPRLVILDAEIATRTPAWLWASTGVRAIDHVVEGFYSRGRTPITDVVLPAALRMLSADLRASVEHPTDLELRERCQVAAWMAIMHLKNVSTGLSHALGHQLGAKFGVPHGVTSCVLLPPVMEFNRPETAERQAVLAEAFGADVTGLTPDEAAQAGVERLRQLLRELEVPTRLHEVGVGPEHFDDLVEETLQDMVVAGNPRPVTAADALTVLHAAA
jgi:alcohol dehydrogenase class IV